MKSDISEGADYYWVYLKGKPTMPKRISEQNKFFFNLRNELNSWSIFVVLIQIHKNYDRILTA